MGERARDKHEIARSVAEDAVGDVDVPLLAYLTSLPMTTLQLVRANPAGLMIARRTELDEARHRTGCRERAIAVSSGAALEPT